MLVYHNIHLSKILPLLHPCTKFQQYKTHNLLATIINICVKERQITHGEVDYVTHGTQKTARRCCR